MELAFPLPTTPASMPALPSSRPTTWSIAQRQTRMVFHYTCVALDPGGYRLRLYSQASELA